MRRYSRSALTANSAPGTLRADSTIDLGTYSDIVHDHDDDARLGFELRWRSHEPVEIKDSRSDLHVTSDALGFNVAIAQRETGRLSVAELKYHVGTRGKPIEIGMRAKRGEKSNEYELTKRGYQPIRNLGRKWPLPPPTRFYGFPDEAVGYYQNTDFLSDLNLQLETLLSSVHYVGPLREYPKRLYLWSGEEPIHVGATGGRAVEALLAGRGRTMNRRHKERHRTLQVIVAQWLEKMRLIESFDVRPIAGSNSIDSGVSPTGPRIFLGICWVTWRRRLAAPSLA